MWTKFKANDQATHVIHIRVSQYSEETQNINLFLNKLQLNICINKNVIRPSCHNVWNLISNTTYLRSYPPTALDCKNCWGKLVTPAAADDNLWCCPLLWYLYDYESDSVMVAAWDNYTQVASISDPWLIVILGWYVTLYYLPNISIFQ